MPHFHLVLHTPISLIAIGHKFVALTLLSLLSLSLPVSALSLAGWEPNTGQWPVHQAYRTSTDSGVSTLTAEGKLLHRVASAGRQVTEVFVGVRTRGWQGVAAQSTRASYFRGGDPSRWRTDVPRFDGLRMENAYPGIDILLQLNASNLERLFELEPNADPALIQLSLSGARQASIDADGSLRLSFRETQTYFEYSAPVAWQYTEQGRSTVAVQWVQSGPQLFGFTLGEYNKSLPLTIDPVSRTTYFGGSAADSGAGYLPHSNGDLYLTSSTSSTDLAGTAGGSQLTPGGGREVAVARLSADLSTLKQVTYYGGTGDEFIRDVRELDDGDLLIVGNTTSTDLPGTTGGAQTAFGGGSQQGDGFAVRLSADLNTVEQATYLGGSGDDTISSIVIDNDNLFVLGTTGSTDFPGVAGGAQTARGDMLPTASDLFVTRMPLTLTTMAQSTYYGGNSFDIGFSFLVNSDGVYVSGSTSSDDLGGTAGGAQPAINSMMGQQPFDAFVVRFNAELTTVTQATYFGGSGLESASSIVELGGSLYLGGLTQSVDLPGVTGGAQSTYGGGTPEFEVFDGFLALISADLTSISQATYFGGNGLEGAFVNTRSSGGTLYLSGLTTSTDLPGTSGAAQPDYGGGQDLGDGFVTSISADLTTLQRTTYIGGSGDDSGIAYFAEDGTLYFSGTTNSSDMPGVTGGLQETFGGADSENLGDIYVATLSPDLTSILQGSYFGGSGDDTGGLLPNSNGVIAYIVGDTTSTNLPATAGAAQATHSNASSSDLFVAAINADLTGSGSTGGGTDPDPSGPIVSAALPGQRVFTLGGPGVTFFGTVINAGSTPAVDCSLALGTAIPATFSYQTTNASNQLIGSANTPVDIPAGAAQSFLFSITPTATFSSTVVMPVYDCINTDPAPVSPGVNTVEVLSTDVATPDVVAIVRSLTNDGIAHIPETTGSVAVAMATVNVGASGEITLSTDTGDVDLGVTVSVCPTNPMTGACLTPPSLTTTQTIESNATPTFSVFVTGSQDIPADPANNRLNLRFKVGDTQVGQSSLALQTD